MKRKVTDTPLKTVEETLKGGEMERVKGLRVDQDWNITIG